jgi:tetratricopeptide (TPR) repeat protein
MSENQQLFQQAMNQGHSAAWDQQWDQAANHYLRALQEFPKHPMALTSIGLAMFELQRYNEALEYYQLAAQVTPADPVPFEKIARIFERTGRLTEAIQSSLQAAELHLKARGVEKAIENWQQVIKLNPGNQAAHTRLAMVFEKMGRKAEAISEYLALASLLQIENKRDKAMQVVEHTLELSPESVEARQAKSLLLSGKPLPKPLRPRGGTGPVSMANVKQLSSPQPDKEGNIQQFDPVSEARSTALVNLAALLFEKAEEDTPTTTANSHVTDRLGRKSGGGRPISTADHTRMLLHLSQAIESQTHGDNAQATEELERAVEIGLKDPAATFNLGMLYMESDTRKALRFLQTSAKRQDYALAANLLIGQVYMQSGSYRDAAGAYLQALSHADAITSPSEHTDELRQLYEPIIEYQMREEDAEKLKAVCNNIASQLLRADWRDYLKNVRLQLPEGDSPALVPVAEIILETSGGQVVDALAQVRQLTNDGKFRTAMDEAFRALIEAPTYLPLHVQIGKILLREGNTQLAVEKFLLVSRLYNLRGEVGQAIQLMKNVVRAVPMDIQVRSHLIELLVDHGQESEAISQYMELANIYYQQVELDMARKHYTSALRLSQQTQTTRGLTVQILFKLADIDQQRLDWRQAARIFEQICTLEPQDVDARTKLVNLKFMLANDSGALTEVDQFIEMLENSGKHEEALAFLEAVSNEHPNVMELRLRWADYLVSVGQTELAIQQLDALADQLLTSGDRSGTIAVMQKIIHLNPPNVAAYRGALKQLENQSWSPD